LFTPNLSLPCGIIIHSFCPELNVLTDLQESFSRQSWFLLRYFALSSDKMICTFRTLNFALSDCHYLFRGVAVPQFESAAFTSPIPVISVNDFQCDPAERGTYIPFAFRGLIRLDLAHFVLQLFFRLPFSFRACSLDLAGPPLFMEGVLTPLNLVDFLR